MRRYYEDVWQRGDMTVAGELVSEQFTDHMSLPGVPPGRAGHHQSVQMIREAFPDPEFTIEHLVADGDRVAGHWTMRATHRGSMLGVPATGKTVTMAGMDIMRWQDGQAAEVWHLEDFTGLLQPVGAIPAPGAGAPA